MIDQEKVKKLFNDRVSLYGDIPTLNISLFQEKHGDLAQRRDEIERRTVMRLIGKRIRSDWRVLDMGCGTGRWSFYLAPMVRQVDAFDFADRLIDICLIEQEELGLDNIGFYVADLGDFTNHPFVVRYDLIIISGVCLYTNDADWVDIMAEIGISVRRGTLIVIREACGSCGRYEVRNQWSEELQVEYSAIYRDPDWFRGIFGTFCKILHDKPLLPPELEKWKETHQRLFIFEVT